jgi:hypothetical protein
MTTEKPKAKRATRANGTRKPTTRAKNTANASRSRERASGKPASRLIDQRIRDLGDWREETLARMGALILEADPETIEEQKWRKPSNAMTGVPVWSHHGIVCTGETYTKVVKLTFARRAQDLRPIASLQFRLGRQHPKGDRKPRRGKGRRGRVQGSREGRGG